MDTASNYVTKGFLSLGVLVIVIKTEAVLEHVARGLGGALYMDVLSIESIYEVAIWLWSAFAIYNFVQAYRTNNEQKRMQQAHVRYIHPRNEVR